MQHNIVTVGFFRQGKDKSSGLKQPHKGHCESQWGTLRQTITNPRGVGYECTVFGMVGRGRVNVRAHTVHHLSSDQADIRSTSLTDCVRIAENFGERLDLTCARASFVELDLRFILLDIIFEIYMFLSVVM